MNRELISLFRNWLNIQTPIVESYKFPEINGTKTSMLIQMCKSVGADQYLSNEGARDYVEEPLLASHGIQHSWQIFTHPTYPQGKEFIKDMSIIDLIFNLGPAATELVHKSGRIFIENKI